MELISQQNPLVERSRGFCCESLLLRRGGVGRIFVLSSLPALQLRREPAKVLQRRPLLGSKWFHVVSDFRDQSTQDASMLPATPRSGCAHGFAPSDRFSRSSRARCTSAARRCQYLSASRCSGVSGGTSTALPMPRGFAAARCSGVSGILCPSSVMRCMAGTLDPATDKSGRVS